jgi:hypothetical protein
VRLLLSRGARQELQDDGDWTALHWAVYTDQSGVVKLLCSAPGAADALALMTGNTVYGRRTPLGIAISMGHASCEALLRAHGAPE